MRKFYGVEWPRGLEDGAAAATAKRCGHDHNVAHGARFGFLTPIGDRDFEAGAAFCGRDVLTTVDRAAAVFSPAIRMVTRFAPRAGGGGLFLRDGSLANRAQTRDCCFWGSRGSGWRVARSGFDGVHWFSEGGDSPLVRGFILSVFDKRKRCGRWSLDRRAAAAPAESNDCSGAGDVACLSPRFRIRRRFRG